MQELRQHFRPEFLNRVDETVLFKPLTLEELKQIVDLQVTELAQRLAARQMKLKVSPEARSLLAQRGYDPVFGARPLKRLLQQEVETPLAAPSSPAILRMAALPT